MATKSSALRNSQADSLVANLDQLELIDGASNVIATVDAAIVWAAASAGSVSPSSDINMTGNANAGGGTAAATARLYDSGATGEEITGLTVTVTGGGGDIELDNTSIADGQAITLPAGNVSITEPASTA